MTLVDLLTMTAQAQRATLERMAEDPAGGELRVLDEEPERFAFFAWKNLTIVTWLVSPDAAAVERLARVGEARIQEQTTGLTDVHLVLGKISFPDAATREALITESRKAVPHVTTVAVALGGEGFWASAMRSFITGIHVLLPGRVPLKLFSGLEELARWLPEVHAERTGVAISAAQLSAVLRDAERHLRSMSTHAA